MNHLTFMVKKPVKKESKLTPFLSSNWFDIDRSIENLRRDMEKAFTSFPSMSMPKMPDVSCDVIDEGKQFRVKLNVPGVAKKEILLNVSDNAIEVHAEHKEEFEEKKKNYLRKERGHISYDRIIPLPEKIDSQKVKSNLKEGVLEITLPKLKPVPIQKKRSVKIQ